MGAHRTKAPPAAATVLPRLFGRYILIHRLSRGGMGEIFLARTGLAGFEKTAVIKKVLPHLAADEEFIQRFVTEAQVAVKLQHANVAQVYEVGRVGDEYFIAIEYIHGRDLRRTMTLLAEVDRRMPPELALFVAREVANGLSYAHRRTDDEGRQLELVHCDISPPNVMMSFEGEVKIIDFGIANSALKMSSRSKRGFGKFGYMAPEQLIRGRQVEAATDVYALGTVLFEMLTGTRLYEVGQTPDYRRLARMAAKGQHPLPSDRDAALAPFDELVRVALRPDPADRYATAAAFRDAIQRQLVELQPTISPDDLAGLMRGLFAEDVRRLKEDIERLDKTRLEHFEGEARETISFAQHGALELASSSVDVDVPAALVGTRPGIGPEPAAATAPRGEPGERTELLPPPPRPASRRRAARRRGLSGWLAAGVVLVVAAGAALAWYTVRGGREARSPAVASPAVAGEVAAEPAVTPLPDAAAPEHPADVVVATDDPTPKEVPESPPAQKRGAAKGARRRHRPRPPSALEPPAVSPRRPTEADARDRVAAKFKRASREYRRFKAEFGPRFESEWNDLATFATYARSGSRLDELERKIDRFRRRIRAASQ